MLSWRDGDNNRDSIRSRVVSSGCALELSSEAFSNRAVVEIVAARVSVESAMRKTGSCEIDGPETSLALLMIERGSDDQVLCVPSDFQEFNESVFRKPQAAKK